MFLEIDKLFKKIDEIFSLLTFLLKINNFR